MATHVVPQPTYTFELTHDEVIAFAGALDALREALLASGKLTARDVTTIRNIESMASKMPDEEWFEEVEARWQHS